MRETLTSKSHSSLEDPIPQASLESILCTEELQRRPSHPPDYEKENHALVTLMRALSDSPTNARSQILRRRPPALARAQTISILWKGQARACFASTTAVCCMPKSRKGTDCINVLTNEAQVSAIRGSRMQ
jgi:hypothetical protein